MNTITGSQNSKKPLVLIVDDLPKNLQILGNLLKNIDCRTAFATSGTQALDMTQKMDVDLVLLDIIMPEMNGFEVCRLMKHHHATREIPIIFLTAAKKESNDVVEGFRLGAVDYITKPINEAELLSRVQTHLELKQSRETILQKNREQNELLHILCHDLANPFINLNTLFEFYEEDKSVLQDFVDSIRISLKNGLATIDLVRNMSSLDEVGADFQLEKLILLDSIKESEVILTSKFIDKKIELNIDVDGSHCVWAEKTSFINSVLNNILTNAIKFSFPGSNIDINAEQEADTIILTIKDYGIGMPNKLTEDVFQLGKSVIRKGTNGERGTGFGMLLVKKFVTAYGGTIEVAAKDKATDPVNHGTEITIRLKTG